MGKNVGALMKTLGFLAVIGMARNASRRRSEEDIRHNLTAPPLK